MADATFVYYPTPLEQAYSLYLAQHIFHIAPNMPLQISGRSAVPFLTKSGVNRVTLRSIWTAADPQNIGTLSQLTQFQLLLRLVSLAQAGFLSLEGSAESMIEVAKQYSGQMLALPVFQSVVIPPHENLMAIYGMFVIQYQQELTQPAGVDMGFGMSPSFGLGVSPGIGNASSFGGVSTVSVDDAFSDLGPTTNAPLPSLDAVGSSTGPEPSNMPGNDVPASTSGGSVADGSTLSGSQGADMNLMTPPVPPVLPSEVTDTEDDEFGEFEDVSATSTPATVAVDSNFAPFAQQMSSDAQNAPAPSACELGAFGEASNQPPPTIGTPAAMGNTMQPSIDGGFGGFSGASVGSELSGSMMGPTASQSFTATPLFDGSVLSSFMDPTPVHGMSTNTGMPTNVNFSVGEFGAAPAQSGAQEDEFGGFEAAAPVQYSTTETFSQPSQGQGGFVGFEPTSVQSQLGSFDEGPLSMVSPSFDGSVRNSSQMLGSTAPASISDAFGEIAKQDAPLPRLDQFGSEASNTATPQEWTSQADNDDFGGFETAASQSVDGNIEQTNSAATGDPFSGIPEVPNHSLPQWDVTSPSNNNAFSTSEPDLGSGPTIPIENHGHSDFGGFENATGQSTPDHLGTTVPSAGESIGVIAPSIGGSAFEVCAEGVEDDPFGGLSVQDAPLTPLGQFSSTSGASIAEPKDSNDDDFEGFEEAPSIPEADIQGEENADGEPFSDIPRPSIDYKAGDSIGFQNPTYQLGQLDVPPEAPSIPGALAFGQPPSAGGMREISALSQGSGFAAPNPSTSTSDDPFSAFDSISAPTQAELPPLSATSTMESDAADADALPAAVEEEEEDDFGDFASSPQPADKGAVSNDTGDNDDEFGEFESTSNAAPSQDMLATTMIPNDTNNDAFSAFQAPQSQQGSIGNSNFDAFVAPSLPQSEEAASLSFTGNPPTAALRSGDDDEFGDFGSTAPMPAQFETPTPTGVEDLFGAFDAAAPQTRAQGSSDFTAFSGSSAQPSEPQNAFDAFAVSSEQLPPSLVSPEPSNDMFGDFGNAAPLGGFDSSPAADTMQTDLMGGFDTNVTNTFVPPTNVKDVDTVAGSTSGEKQESADGNDDDWGDFGGASVTVESNEEALESAKANHEQNQSTDFGAFDEPGFQRGDNIAAEDSFGVFDEAPPLPSTTSDKAEKDSNLANFDETPANPASPIDTSDEWGDFEEVPTMAGQNDAATEDDFGDFEAFNPTNSGLPSSTMTADAPSGTKEDQKNDFDAFNSADSDDDWGDFENVSVPSTPVLNDGPLLAKIRALSMPLSETLLRKSNQFGGQVDLGECFEVNLGSSYALDTERKARVDRCLQLLEILSKMNHYNGSTYWEQVLKVINDDLAQGVEALSAAKALSPEEMKQVSQPFQTMLSGLKEYIRVARHIVAAIGDILLIDPKALLTIDTMASTWCSLSILQIALDIESKWKKVLEESKSLLGISIFVDVPSLTEIRLASLICFENGNLCDLTLQPLLEQNIGTTMVPVVWNGRPFMACSANLLAYRCPFYVGSN